MDLVTTTLKRALSKEILKHFLDLFVYQILFNHPILNHLLTALQNLTGIDKHYPLYTIVLSLYMYLVGFLNWKKPTQTGSLSPDCPFTFLSLQLAIRTFRAVLLQLAVLCAGNWLCESETV